MASCRAARPAKRRRSRTKSTSAWSSWLSRTVARPRARGCGHGLEQRRRGDRAHRGTRRSAGADGALLISPYYNKPTQDGIVAHYAEIARATRFPARRLQHSRPHGSNILPDTIARLAELEQVVGREGKLRRPPPDLPGDRARAERFRGARGRRLGDAAAARDRRRGRDLHVLEPRARRDGRAGARVPRAATERARASCTTACCRCAMRSSARPTRFR